MAKFTQERWEIRNLRKLLEECRDRFRAEMQAAEAAIDELQEKCPHPAVKRGNYLGMSWCDCPDCGASR